MPRIARDRLAALLAAFYGVASALWILLSDDLVQAIATSSEQITRLQHYKGWGFVLLSTVLVYALLAGAHRVRRRSDAAASHHAATRDELARVFDAIPAGIYVFRRDAHGTVTFPYASRAFDDIVGITAANVTADVRRMDVYTHPDDRQRIADSMAASARDLTPWRATFRMRHPRKGEVWIEGRSAPIRQPDGSVLWYGILEDVSARMRYERALLENEERLRLAHEAAGIGTWLHDIESDRIRADDKAKEHFGLIGDEFTVTQVQQHVHPDDVGRLRATISAAVDPVDSDGRHAADYRVIHADGSVRWVSILARVHFEDVNGQRRAVLCVGTTQDITARRRDEELLRDSEEQLRTALEAAQLGTWRHDLLRDTVSYDTRAKEHFGHARSSIPWSDALERVHPEDQARVAAAVRQATDPMHAEDRYAVGYRVVDEDGTIRWLAVQGRVHFNGGESARHAVVRIGTSQDITDRIETEAALRESEARWQFALEGTEQGLWDWNILTNEIYYSGRWKALRGCEPHEIPGGLEEWAKRVHPEDLPRVLQDLERHVAGTDPAYQSEYRIRRKDGDYLWILDRGKAIERDEAGQPLRMIGTNTDISSRKAMETALRESELRANLIIDTAPNAMMVIGADGRVVRANARAALLFGYPLEAMLDLGVEELIPARLRAHHRMERTHYARAASPRPMGEGRPLLALRRDGSEFPVEVSLGPLHVAGKQETVVMLIDISLRREAELTIERLAEIVKTSADVLALIDREGRYQVANPAYARLYGRTPEDLQGRRKTDVLPIDILAQVRPALQLALAGESSRVVVTAVFSDGHEHVLEMDYRPFSWNGEIAGVVTSGRDVTGRTRVELALRESEQALEHAQNMAHVGSWTLDIATRTFQRSAEASRIIGVPAGTVPWDVAMATIHPDDAGRVKEAWDRTLAGAPYDIEHRSVVDGKVRWTRIRAVVVRDDAGRPVKVIGMTQDITEIHEAQLALEAHREHLERLVAARTSELRQQTRYLRTLIDGFPFMVWLKDTQHRYLAINRRAGEVLPMPAGEIPGKSDMDLFPEPHAQRYRADDEEVIRTRAPKLIETPLESEDRTVWLETFKAPVMDEDGSVLGTVGYTRDITERRAAERAREQALAEATRLAQARSAFLANMSHEIRTPLNAVLGLAQLGARSAVAHASRDTFSRIVDSGRLLLGIVNDVLDYAKIEAGKLELAHEPFELGTTLDQAIDLVSTAILDKGLRFEVHEAPDLPTTCEGDSLRLAQVLVNLLSNAAKFTHQGHIALRVALEGADLLFEVEDSGIGMTAEQMARLFAPFEQADSSTTRRFGGTGLGLTITHHLVEAMGGAIDLRSSADVGSCFRVRMPARVLHPAAPRLPVMVLLAELDDAEAGPLAAALRSRGATVHTADLELIDAGEFDLALCDSARLSPAQRAQVEARARTGSRIALTGTTEGDSGLRRIERPLRARHLIEAATAAAASQPPPAHARLAGLRVLAAEDNEINRLVLEDMFALEGGDLVQVENGARALERLERDGPEHYHVMLSDVQMPEMDGYETARQIRTRGWTLPILGLSAHAMSEERERCLAAGMTDYLPKPFEVDTLVAAVLRLHAGTARQPDGAASSAEAAAIQPEGAVDWEALAKRFGNKQPFIDRLVASALCSHAEAPARLRDAAAQRDFPGIAFVAHSIRGTCGNLCAHAVQRLAHETETCAKECTSSALQLSLRLAEDTESLLAELRRRSG
ncbi:MAG: PAS domain S-box protein [Burkholderiales bacterium]|nr:PAS domain S-box protein [Burkholderiales bacterium]